MTSKPHVTVCICTYRRAELLPALISELCKQETRDKFTFSIAVVDNDYEESAREAVTYCASTATVPVEYFVEPRQNIAHARNLAVAGARGEYLAFIDDDEIPAPRWLLALYESCHKYGADGSLGPVKPTYEKGTPGWVIDGKFYDRPSYPTGLMIDWKKGRTGNVLLKKDVFAALEIPFRPEFRAGEDQDFFRRAIDKGYYFIWCHEAMAYETVPPFRWKRTVMLRRALLRGATAALDPTLGLTGIVKSLIAVPGYAIALPFVSLLGHGYFMRLLVKLCDHLGKLLALIRLNPIRDQYVTER